MTGSRSSLSALSVPSAGWLTRLRPPADRDLVLGPQGGELG